MRKANCKNEFLVYSNNEDSLSKGKDISITTQIKSSFTKIKIYTDFIESEFEVEIPTADSYGLSDNSVIIIRDNDDIPTNNITNSYKVDDIRVYSYYDSNENDKIFNDYEKLREYMMYNIKYFQYINYDEFIYFHNYLKRSYEVKEENDKNLTFPEYLHISSCSFKGLGLNEWFNDEIINSYIQLINRKLRKRSSRSFVFSTYFFPKLLDTVNYSFEKLVKFVINSKSKTNKLYKFYYIPIILDHHWSLMKINIKKREMFYYDSINNEKHLICQTYLSRFFDDLRSKIMNLNTTNSDWDVKRVKDIPQQNNYSDCGVFLCVYLKYLIKKRNMIFTSYDIPYFRILIGVEIIRGKLII